MTDKRKRIARALAAKTGMSYQAAINVLDARAIAKDRAPIEIDALLQELGPVFAVAVRRAPAVGRSADPQVAAEKSRYLSEHPTYYAETGAIMKTVARE